MTATNRSTGPAAPVVPVAGVLRPLGLDEVRLRGGFWGARQETNAAVTLEHCESWLERLGWIDNFDRTAAGETGERAGREFADSETYKLLEALAWESARSGRPEIESAYQALASRVVKAQQSDGYLNTRFGGPGQAARFSDLQWGHELYCAGHLIQAAVARARTAGEDDLVRTARRLADLVCDTFGPGGIESVCGHPEIEMALVEFARATGEDRYRQMAGLFLERRGRGVLGEIELGSAYFQDDVPIREAEVLRGHAVRALYLTSAAVDFAVDTDDSELLARLVSQWERTVARRTYLTGGMGSRHEGESFGEDFELPPDRAYSETCAGVGSVMLAWRLLLATGQPRFADLLERTLLNVVATGPDARGDAFFYANPLQQRRPSAPAAGGLNPRASGGQRAPWFAVSCCPTNIARTFASLGCYVATVDDEGLQIHQYTPAEIATHLPDGRPVRVAVETAYPDDGRITVTVEENAAAAWTLSLRIPAWAAGRAALTDEDGRHPIDGDVVQVRRAFRAGERVTLELPVEPRWTRPDPRIDAVRGTLAVEAGPVVLCAESIDLPEGLDLDHLGVVTDVAPWRTSGGGVRVRAATIDVVDHGWPYDVEPGAATEPLVDVPLVPYHQWAERGPSAMRVWLPAAGGDRASAATTDE